MLGLMMSSRAEILSSDTEVIDLFTGLSDYVAAESLLLGASD